MNTKQIVQGAAQKLAENPGMGQPEFHEVIRKVVNYTIDAVIKEIKDDDNPIKLREKIKKMEVK